jgi:hypothetical protein
MQGSCMLVRQLLPWPYGADRHLPAVALSTGSWHVGTKVGALRM